MTREVTLRGSGANAVGLLAPSWRPREKGGGLVLGVELETEISNRAAVWTEERLAELGEKYRNEEHVFSYRYGAPHSLEYKAALKQVGLVEDVFSKVGSDFIIGKRDGSLNHGVEFVSKPAPMWVHRKRWARLFNDLPPTVSVSKRCGLHIHVGKHNLTPSMIGQAIALTTTPAYKPWVTKLAGRTSEEYAKLICKTKASYTSLGKYEAVNTNPGRTIEFRLFAATLKADEFNQRIEYVHALLTWAKEQDIDQDTIATKGLELFVEWVMKQKPARYPALSAFIQTVERPDPSKLAEAVEKEQERMAGEYAIDERTGERVDREWLTRYNFRANDVSGYGVPRNCDCVDCVNERTRVLRNHLTVRRLGLWI